MNTRNQTQPQRQQQPQQPALASSKAREGRAYRPTSFSPHVSTDWRICWGCEGRFALSVMVEMHPVRGLTVWQCPSCRPMPTHAGKEQQALTNARQGLSEANYAAIYDGFMALGLDRAAIVPRGNVFTASAWKALGRTVKADASGVAISTAVPCDRRRGGRGQGMRQQATAVFHVSQTELSTETHFGRAN